MIPPNVDRIQTRTTTQREHVGAVNDGARNVTLTHPFVEKLCSGGAPDVHPEAPAGPLGGVSGARAFADGSTRVGRQFIGDGVGGTDAPPDNG
jgi:hypothetical protein